jgi:outer membrane protein OmpA-like peptidoglycan-associated protein
VFCDQCPERTPKQLSLPTPIAPIVARTVPETPAIKRTQRWALHFSLGSSRLGTASRVMLNEVVSALNAHPLLRISIQGHTDLVGAQRFNKRLASGRARAVRDALLALGIPGARIEPLAANCCIEHPPITNPSARRVDVLIKPMGNQYDK